MNKAIEFKNVSFSYEKDKKILEDVSFSMNYGEITLLAGNSGEGKSTLLKIMTGIIPNIEYGYLDGEIKIDNFSLKGRKVYDICNNIGVIFQNPDEQIVQKYVEDEIAFGLENLAFSKEEIKMKIEKVCSLFKLDKNSVARNLSGGQKQRLISASIIAMGQKIILLDEPLANLDKEGSQELLTILKSLALDGYAILVIEHRLDVIIPYIDKVLLLSNKKVNLIEDKNSFVLYQTKEIEDTCNIIYANDFILEAKDVSFNIKDKIILKNINHSFKRGSRTVILGENGCGKTTLLRLLAKLYIPSEGKIIQYIDSRLKQRKRGDKKYYQKVGIIYQNPDYQLFMPSVEKELYFSAYSLEYANEIASLFELKNLYARHPQSLSEGQKRRLSIACVLASKPEVVLLDEPTVGQDYEFLAKLVNNLNYLHAKTNNTLITITHDIRCASALADESLIIKEKQIIKSGGKELIKEYFAS